MFDATFTPPINFVYTQPMPCPYINHKMERRLATDISTTRGKRYHNILAEAGFRRSQHISYKPACPSCSACKPIRVVAKTFTRTKSQKRIYNRNQDLVTEYLTPVASPEFFELFRNYQMLRHSGGEMALMDYADFRGMLETSPINTFIKTYRLKISRELVGVVLLDEQKDGYSAVYSFFNCLQPERSMGTFIILDLIEDLRHNNLNYLYLGYWIEKSRKMSYKANFRPAEILTSSNWVELI
tara:strand:- start:3562 stop:4284 length:723 start_codon:yes stop_codon:yes gene_type:complete